MNVRLLRRVAKHILAQPKRLQMEQMHTLRANEEFMAITKQITCDMCGKPKGDVNHWWIGDFVTAKGGNAWGLTVWSDDEAAKVGRSHLCGQSCVIQAVNKFMSDLGGK